MYGLTNQKCLKSDKVAESIMGTMAVGGIKISGHESLRKHAEFKCRLCSTGINHRDFSHHMRENLTSQQLRELHVSRDQFN